MNLFSKHKKFLFVTTLCLLVFLEIGTGSSFARSKQLGCGIEFKRNLGLGSFGTDVRELRLFLKDKIGNSYTEKDGQFFTSQLQDALQMYKNSVFKTNTSTPVFDSKTREKVNAICNQTEDVNLTLYLSAQKNYSENTRSIRVFIKSNLPISGISESGLILQGVSAFRLRKLSKDEYFVSLTPDTESKRIVVQLEAGSVKSGGLENELASNEIIIDKLVNIKTNYDLKNNSQTQSNIDVSVVSSEYVQENVKSIAFSTSEEIINYLKTVFSNDNENVIIHNIRKYSTRVFLPGERTISDYTDYVSAVDNVWLDSRELVSISSTSSMVNIEKEVKEGSFSRQSTQPYLGQIDRYFTSKFSIVGSYFRLKSMLYLRPSETRPNSEMPKLFDKTILDTSSILCNRLVTFQDDKVIHLYEDSENYEFRLKLEPNKSYSLLAYPKIAREFWNLECFTEEETQRRYFPNGLFCCTDLICNNRDIIEPLLYSGADGKQAQVKLIYTTVLSDFYTRIGNTSYSGSATSRKINSCGNYKIRNVNSDLNTQSYEPIIHNDSP